MFKQIIADIKSGSISGPENLPLWSLKAFKAEKTDLDNTCVFINTYLKNLDKAKTTIFEVISSDPATINIINYIFDKETLSKYKTLKEIQIELNKKITKIEKHLEKVYLEIGRNGANKIKENSVVYTHGYSSTVLRILNDAKCKNFKVNITEARPYGNGKKMAEEIAKLNIPVTIYSDSSIRLAVKSSNMVLLGCEAASENKFINTMGSELVAEIANKYDIPIYICTDCMKKIKKFNIDEMKKGIERLNEKIIIFDKTPKLITIKNTMFEKIDPKLITAVICDIGIIKPEEFFDLEFE
jgi:translation initiation factor 2B subunit (eIF-2B alpha/beta/delta family)